jgi:hypothetical protein
VSPDPWLQRIWAAWLAVGRSGAVSHATAAALERLAGYPLGGPIELIAAAHSHHRVDGAFVHQFADLRPHHVIAGLPACPGLPVTTPSRTVVDLAARASPSRLRAILTEGAAAGQLDLAGVGATLADVARRGKPGVRRLGRVLDELGGGPVPASAAESAFLAVLAAHGILPPEPQVPLPGRGAVAGVVDGVYAEAKVIVEVDSRRWHGRFVDMANDRLRDAEAAMAGYLTLRIMYEHIVADPGWVAATVQSVVQGRTLRRAS